MVRANLPVSPELVAFYKSRLDAFDAERAAAAALVEQASVERGRVYRLEQAASKAAAQVHQLQKALAESHLQLFEVRDQVGQLQAERASLLLEGKQDKARIQSLLAFTQPVLHDVHYANAEEPAGVATHPLATKRNGRGTTGQSPHEVLRTVFLPNEEAQLLVAKLAALQAQLAHQHAFSQERITALLDDRKQREDAAAAQAAEASSKLEDLQAQLDKRCTLLERTTRELLLCRHQQQAAERDFQERLAEHASGTRQAQRESRCMRQQLDLALELLPRQCADAVRAMGTALAQAASSDGTPGPHDDSGDDPAASCREAALAAAAEAQSGAERRALRQAAALEAELKSSRGAAHSVGRQQQQRIRQLEQQLHSLKGRTRELEYRRALDIQGFASEMGLVRKQLVSIQRRVREVALDAETGGTDPLSIVEQLAAVRDQLDAVAAKMLDQRDRGDT
ncbi:hypothetical protein KFL_006890100 [Klebsormidium nitens]|uniref:Uncharacterized protein n=1 Tax=Klebsormidium nitens TaxID=105231 RepID=A0A1Y1IIY4_KLENI|nr:hypothetical protein KFL_006890100 [Klebsormidium nitens]|eukprot:GAQ90825.1 hypothetical protein KFL_006890100 [Klebsormidium nitens]